MKIKPSKSPGNVVMVVGDHDSDRLSEPASVWPFVVKKVLVPVDFSDGSKKVVQYAVPFAKQFNGTIIFLLLPGSCTFGEGPRAAHFDNSARELEELADQFVPREVPVRIETCFGADAVEIAAEAKKLEADLIVVSTHGHTEWAHALPGGVAENLVRLAPCPVLVVREHEHAIIQDECANLSLKAVS